MFHKFCQGFRPLNTSPSQVILDSPRLTKMPSAEAAEHARAMATRSGTPLGFYPSAAGYKKIIQMQNIMTRDDGLLVWQKLPRDRVLSGVTAAICVLGLGVAFNTLYRMSVPKKVE